MNAPFNLFCDRLLAALCNGGYQGLLLTLLIWIGLRLAPRTNAATRHAIWMVTLVMVALLPAVHFFAATERDSVSGSTSHPAEKRQVQSHSLSTLAPLAQTDSDENQEMLFPFDFEGTIAIQPEEFAPFASEVPAPFPEDPLGETRVNAEPPAVVAAPAATGGWRFSLPAGITAWLAAIWMILAGARLANLAWQYHLLRALKRQGELPPQELRERFDGLSEELAMSRNPRLIICAATEVPMAVGFKHPAVLLPARLLQDSCGSQIDPLLRHELAHLSRGDDWANLAQQTLSSVLFFHPAVWWISQRLTAEREIACDDHVLAATRSPQVYALLLTEFASQTLCRDWAVTTRAWGNKSQLKERITMILDAKRNSSTRLGRTSTGFLTTAAVLIAALSLHIAPRLAFAQDQSGSDDSNAPSPTPQPRPEEVTESYPSPNLNRDESANDANSRADSVTLTTNHRTSISSVVESPVEVSSRIAVTGPRAKPSPVPEVDVNPQPVPSVTVPVPPRALASIPPVPASIPSARVTEPKPPKAMSLASAGTAANDSIERRLERLERMTESLLAREGQNKQTSTYYRKDASVDAKRGRFEINGKPDGLSEEEIARIKQKAEKDMNHAAKEIDRVRKEMALDLGGSKRTSRADEKYAQSSSEPAYSQSPFEVKRKALENQQKTLEKQILEVRRQLDRMKEEQKQVEDEGAAQENRLNELEHGKKPGSGRNSN